MANIGISPHNVCKAAARNIITEKPIVCLSFFYSFFFTNCLLCSGIPDISESDISSSPAIKDNDLQQDVVHSGKEVKFD